ncbi:hypothetical protein JL721_17 [Aureococcus anophagefferens]|nr:hypothetical protein JL721_17 [Aureococcus anophagefferens]
MASRVLLALALAAPAAAECPNACSGHGTCGAFDECHCYPNWQEADCSGRTCPFALAHVDSPKGDLDGSADALSGTSSVVITESTVYPYGTTEQYPLMVDTFGRELKNTAHAYAECGNKGICDRKSGECECFPGYEGAGCQRASCPDPTCSGHGTCMSAKDLATADFDNVYRLWDKDVSMGCMCEPGYSGPSCADKMCKYGVDPLYDDDEMMSIRVPTARVVMSFDNSSATTESEDGVGYTYETKKYIDGTYAIKFYDVFGEDYQTAPLAASAGCAEVVTALEELPNSVIPANSVRCFDSFDYSGDKVLFGNPTKDLGNQGFVTYDLLFEENPGDLKPMEVNAYLDGARPTVYVANANSTSKQDFDVDIAVYPNYFGISGEFTDYFSDYCDGVVFTVADWAGGATFPTTSDKADNNVEVYNWDYGSWNTTYHPHIVKVAPHPTSGVSPKEDVYDAGKFMLMYFEDEDNTATGGAPGGTFYSSGQSVADRDYIVFTTDGVATLLANGTDGHFGTGTGGFTDMNHNPVTAYFEKGTDIVYTSQDVSCYSGTMHGVQSYPWAGGSSNENAAYSQTSAKFDTLNNTCLEKGDFVFLFSNKITTFNQGDSQGEGFRTSSNAAGNMYKIVKIGVNPTSASTYAVEDRFYFVVDKVINYDGSEVAARALVATAAAGTAAVSSVIDADYTDDDLRETPSEQMIGLQSIVKFAPASTGNYEYVSQCSGRGLCDAGSGLCECFTGYTNDNCDQQSALAV